MNYCYSLIFDYQYIGMKMFNSHYLAFPPEDLDETYTMF